MLVTDASVVNMPPLVLLVVMMLLRMVRMVVLEVHRHAISLMPLPSIHHDMLPLMALVVHAERVVSR